MDLGEKSRVDLDRVDTAARPDGLGEWALEEPGSGTDVGNRLPRLQLQPGDDLVDLHRRDAHGTVERLDPLVGGP